MICLWLENTVPTELYTSHAGQRTAQNYEAHEAANTEVCWIYLNYWSCWRHLGRETVVTEAKLWQNDRYQLCWVLQSSREHSVTNDQAHSFVTAENLVGMELFHFSMTGIPWMLNVQRAKVAIWVWKGFYNTEDLYQIRLWTLWEQVL